MQILINKISDVSKLLTTSVVNKHEVKNKVPVVIQSRKQTMTLKYQKFRGKNITTYDYNKFTKEILDARIKQKELVNKSNISNPAKKN